MNPYPTSIYYTEVSVLDDVFLKSNYKFIKVVAANSAGWSYCDVLRPGDVLRQGPDKFTGILLCNLTEDDLIYLNLKFPNPIHNLASINSISVKAILQHIFITDAPAVSININAWLSIPRDGSIGVEGVT